MVLGMDNKALYPPDGAVGGEDVFSPAHLYFSDRNSSLVMACGQGYPCRARRLSPSRPYRRPYAQPVNTARTASGLAQSPIPHPLQQELRLFCLIERFELRDGR